MRYDLIVHVNREEDFSMKAALGAAGNYLAALPDGNFKLVASGEWSGGEVF